MNTVLLTWNPGFSSFRMLDHLHTIESYNADEELDYYLNWAIRDYDKVTIGDRYYMVKLGLGGVGIVGCGTITTMPMQGDDWRGEGRKIYYSEFKPEVMLNPDAVSILTCEELSRAIPEVNWYHWHSGVVLSEEVAEKLNKLWDDFLLKYRVELVEKGTYASSNDKVYWNILKRLHPE